MEKKKPGQLAIMLRRLRESNELTQEFVASRLNVSRSTYSYYEIGKTEPSLKSLSILAKMFGISVEDFLHEEKAVSFRDSEAYQPHQALPPTMGSLTAEERQLVAIYRLAGMKAKKKAVTELQKENTPK